MFNPILSPIRSYAFSDYIDLPYEVVDIVSCHGYQLVRQKLVFSEHGGDAIPQGLGQDLENLCHKTTERLKKVYFSADIAQREIYITPLLFVLSDWLDFTVRIEHYINLTERLNGTLDYLLTSPTANVVIFHAKKNDLPKGLAQLATGAIAVATDNFNKRPIFGAVTTGNVWQFAIIDPQTKTVIEDIQLYTSPMQIEKIAEILALILTAKNLQDITEW